MELQKTLFGKNIAPACEYCAKNRTAQGGLTLHCTVSDDAVPPYHHCDAFVYDPLRRVPKRIPKLPTFSADDFKL